MLATYMPAPHLKYSRQMTKWECERVTELVDIADAEYLASNMKGTRAYQPGWALLVQRTLACFFLVIRGTVNKGDLVLNLDAISTELESGVTLHAGMQKQHSGSPRTFTLYSRTTRRIMLPNLTS